MPSVLSFLAVITVCRQFCRYSQLFPFAVSSAVISVISVCVSSWRLLPLARYLCRYAAPTIDSISVYDPTSEPPSEVTQPPIQLQARPSYRIVSILLSTCLQFATPSALDHVVTPFCMGLSVAWHRPLTLTHAACVEDFATRLDLTAYPSRPRAGGPHDARHILL